MQVSIDCTPLLVRSAGVKNYLYHWTRSLQGVVGDHRISVFPFLNGFGRLDHERSPVGFLGTAARLAYLHFLNVTNLAKDWLAPRAEVFHCSNQLRNPPHNCKLTANSHDMTCWLMPHLHKPANVAAEKRFADEVLRRADGVITGSENSRRDAIEILRLNPDKVEVIHYGVPEYFFHVSAEAALRVKRKYGLHRPYLLSVGTVEPRKNLDALLDAYEQLDCSLRREFEVVIAGPLGWAPRQTVDRLLSPAAGVRYVRYVPEEDLPGLTAGATLSIYPSFYEGFGFPLVQAMAAGVPVIASHTGSFPEIAGECALFVDPMSVDSIRAALERLLLSPSVRSDLAKKGRLRAQRYTWRNCAEKSWKFFETVCGNGRN